jgi:hypothetical protein
MHIAVGQVSSHRGEARFEFVRRAIRHDQNCQSARIRVWVTEQLNHPLNRFGASSGATLDAVAGTSTPTELKSMRMRF